MIKESCLTEFECLELIRSAADALRTQNTESAAGEIVKAIRGLFGVSCVRIREIFSRPFSLRYTYESIDVPENTKRVNETVSFEEDVWKGALQKFSEGCYIFKADGEQSEPQFVGPIPKKPVCMIQIPMYSGSEFFGVLDLVDFEAIHEWSECEVTALTVCADMLCQHLYRLNSAFMQLQSENGTDSLTGLMNFSTFTDKLDEKLLEMLSDAPIAVVNVDIHHFKYINETYGYKKGDEILKLAAQAIVDGISKYVEIMICRAYADNFISAAIVPESFIPYFEGFVHEQNEQISRLLQEKCPNVRIRIDTGICYVRESNITAATAIANANLARKNAKQENLQRPLVFSEEMMEEIRYQEYLNNALPKAIENHELKVFYQPKINCADETLYGAEALIRWQKPDGSFIYPDKFIPVFEKNGNIVDVDFYVYREVFRYIRGRIDAGIPVFPISMNVSRIHFRSDRIIPYIASLLEEYQVPPELVEFELTENIYMNNFNSADVFIASCRERGIQVSMDDFGSGYSSLNVISSLHIDTLKIDKIFLRNAELGESDKTVISNMITMAKQLGMRVICEGVETESQTVFLKNANCDQIQGYYYGKPMDELTFDQFVASRMN